jgi:hypothetical protein
MMMWIVWTISIALTIYLAIFIAPIIAAYAAMWGETYRVSVPEFSDRDGIPTESQQRLQPWLDDLIDRGFEIARYQVFHDNLVGKPRYAPYWGIVLQHQLPPIFAAVTDLPQSSSHQPIICSLSSYAQGQRSMTINLRQELAGDSLEQDDRICYVDGANVSELSSAHQQFIESLTLERLSIDEWLAIVDRQNWQGIERMLSAGKLVWVDRDRQIYRHSRRYMLKLFWQSLGSLWTQIRTAR